MSGARAILSAAGRAGLAVLAASCGGAAQPGAARPVVLELPPVAVASSEAPQAAQAASAEPEAALPPAIELPAGTACVIEGPWQPRGEATLLRLRDRGPVFAEVGGGVDARLHLPPGRPSGAAIEVDAGGVSLRGRVDAEAIPIRPARPIAFQGFAVPLGATLLELGEAAEGKVTVTWPGAEGIKPLHAPVSERLRCDDVTVGELEIDAVVAAGVLDGEREARLRLGRAIPLSATPGGPPAAELLPADDEDADVTVVGISGGRSRVLWWREDALIVGWVPSAELRPKPSAGGLLGEAFGVGGLGLRGIGEGEARVCAADVPLLAQAGGERATVGAVRAGTAIEVLDRGAPYARVSVDTGGVWIAEGAALYARAAELARCERRAK